MKLKTVLLLIISFALIIFSSTTAYATQYVFDENGVVIAEIEDTTSGYVFDENGVVIAEPGQPERSEDGKESDIAIIGGADGPTAIFVAEPDPTFLFVALGVAIISLAVILIVLIKRRKK